MVTEKSQTKMMTNTISIFSFYLIRKLIPGCFEEFVFVFIVVDYLYFASFLLLGIARILVEIILDMET